MKIRVTHYYVVNGTRSQRINYDKTMNNMDKNALNEQLDPLRDELKSKHKCDQINLEYTIIEIK